MSYTKIVTYFDWSEEKNIQLQKEREISFEDIVIGIESAGLLDILEHPNKKKYAGQKIFIVNVNDYAYVVPFVEEGEKIFLKTIIPSRKATKKYIIKKGA